jgi:hypothetical protein
MEMEAWEKQCLEAAGKGRAEMEVESGPEPQPSAEPQPEVIEVRTLHWSVTMCLIIQQTSTPIPSSIPIYTTQSGRSSYRPQRYGDMPPAPPAPLVVPEVPLPGHPSSSPEPATSTPALCR